MKDRVKIVRVIKAGELKLAAYLVLNPETQEYGQLQFHATYGDTVLGVMGEASARLYAKFVLDELGAKKCVSEIAAETSAKGHYLDGWTEDEDGRAWHRAGDEGVKVLVMAHHGLANYPFQTWKGSEYGGNFGSLRNAVEKANSKWPRVYPLTAKDAVALVKSGHNDASKDARTLHDSRYSSPELVDLHSNVFPSKDAAIADAARLVVGNRNLGRADTFLPASEFTSGALGDDRDMASALGNPMALREREDEGSGP